MNIGIWVIDDDGVIGSGKFSKYYIISETFQNEKVLLLYIQDTIDKADISDIEANNLKKAILVACEKLTQHKPSDNFIAKLSEIKKVNNKI